jgi:hypothetical protein
MFKGIIPIYFTENAPSKPFKKYSLCTDCDIFFNSTPLSKNLPFILFPNFFYFRSHEFLTRFPSIKENPENRPFKQLVVGMC